MPMNLMFQTSIGQWGIEEAFLRPKRLRDVHAIPRPIQALQTEVAFRCDADWEGIQERNQSEARG